MIIYNVTVKVDPAIAGGWLDWMQKEHIPEIIATGCFTHANILHLFELDDEEGITYAIQYHALSREKYMKYIEEFAPALRKKALEKWGDRFIAFRSVMKIVS
jgi:hypothetical protein